MYFDPTAFRGVTGARFGTAGYNSLRGPGTRNLDFRIYRTFRFTERFNAQFRAATITSTSGIGREGVDERLFRFGLRFAF